MDVQHVATAYFLYDFYNILAKVQHGVCKINQSPLEYNENIEKMKKSLNELKDKIYEGHAKQNEAFTKSGIFNNGIPIVTEFKNTQRSVTSLDKQMKNNLKKALDCG